MTNIKFWRKWNAINDMFQISILLKVPLQANLSLDSTKNRKKTSNADHISIFVHVSSKLNYNSVSMSRSDHLCTISGPDCFENAFGFSARLSSGRNRF